MISDEEDIEASLKILLGTAFGERFLNPKYGLHMHAMLFEPMSTTTTTFFKDRQDRDPDLRITYQSPVTRS